MRFTDQSIIVTGAGSGIGRAAALLFAAEGGRVVVADVTDGADETARMIAAAGGTAATIRMDAGDEADVICTVARVRPVRRGRRRLRQCRNLRRHGDDLRYRRRAHQRGAPRLPDRPVSDGEARGAEDRGARWRCDRPHRQRRRHPLGRGIAGVLRVQGWGHQLAMVSAQQLSGSNVPVNTVCSGLTGTWMTEPTLDYARDVGKLDRVGRLNPLRRGAQPEELANVALFLASADASYVNGQAIAVDGVEPLGDQAGLRADGGVTPFTQVRSPSPVAGFAVSPSPNGIGKGPVAAGGGRVRAT